MKYQYYTTLAYEQVSFSCEASATDISFENQLDAISQLLYFTIAMRSVTMSAIYFD
jgi:hypothetical protein